MTGSLKMHEQPLIEVEMSPSIELELDPPLNQIKHKFESEYHKTNVEKCLRTDSRICSGHES